MTYTVEQIEDLKAKYLGEAWRGEGISQPRLYNKLLAAVNPTDVAAFRLAFNNSQTRNIVAKNNRMYRGGDDKPTKPTSLPKPSFVMAYGATTTNGVLLGYDDLAQAEGYLIQIRVSGGTNDWISYIVNGNFSAFYIPIVKPTYEGISIDIRVAGLLNTYASGDAAAASEEYAKLNWSDILKYTIHFDAANPAPAEVIAALAPTD